MAMTYPIAIADYNSAGIQDEAGRLGITHMREVASVAAPGGMVRLLALPLSNGEEIRVIDTNADPEWEEQDPAAFAACLAHYGFAAEG